jgi:serine/threonine protein kinase/Flp pilus assembly protein TadD
MASEIRQTVEDLFQTVCELAPEERAAYLDRVCADDEGLRREVEELLKYHNPDETFLENPALQDAARRMANHPPPPDSQQITRADTLREGDWMLGPYRILDQLGKGGMGVVYLAQDTRDGRQVAIKVLPKDYDLDEDRLARFSREGRMLEELKSLKHPNIAEIYEQAEYDGKPCIVLEYVPGDTLADRLSHGPAPIAEALQIGLQIADALQSAHQQGIVHRDLKPANIKITPEGRVKVLDFGLAKRFQAEVANAEASELRTRSLSLTESGMLIGTPAYMSPEQWEGKQIDQRTDIWAFGCLLFEMLSGQPPFARKTRPEIMKAVCEADVSWSALPSDTPLLILDLLRRCLNRDLNSRAQQAGEVRRLIVEALGGRKLALWLFFKSLLWKIDRRTALALAVSVFALALILAWNRTPLKDWVRRSQGLSIEITTRDDLATILAGRIKGADPELVRAALTPDQQSSVDLLAQSYALRENHEYPEEIDRIIAALNERINTGREPAQLPQLYSILAQAHLLKFYLNSKIEDKNAAVAACQKAYALSPETFEVRVALGNISNAIKSHDQAVNIFEGLRQKQEYGNAPEVLGGLALAYDLNDSEADDNLAESLYTQAISECQKQGGQQCWEYYSDLGAFYFTRGRYDLAETQWRQVTVLKPLKPDGFRNLADALLYRGCVDEAINNYSESIRRQETADAYSNRGAAFFFQERYDEAIRDFERVTIYGKDLTGAGAWPSFWGNLGDAYRRVNRNSEAEQAYRKALDKLNAVLIDIPNSPENLAYKAELLAKLNSVGAGASQEDPIKLIERVLSSDKECVECQAAAVFVYHLSGKRNEAIRAAEKAVGNGYSAFFITQNPELSDLKQERLFQRLIPRNPSGC